MKILALKLLILLAIILIALNARAQTYPDYVIMAKGDSVPCKLDNYFFGIKRYKTDTMSVSKEINANEIVKIYTGKPIKLYKPVYIEDKEKPQFLSVVEQGQICIYELVTQVFTKYGPVPAITWYIGKNSDHPRVIKGERMADGGFRSERKEYLANLLADNKPVYNKFITDNNFDFNDIQNIVHLYNVGELLNENVGVFKNVPNYIINPNNDTISCRVKNDFFKGYFTSKTKDKNDFVKIDSLNAKEFSYLYKTFVLKALPENDRKEFMQLLTRGRINLYEYRTTVISGKKEIVKYNWYMSKENGSFITIKADADANDDIRLHKEFMKAFKSMIADNSEMLKQFNEAASSADPESYFNSDEVVKRIINNYDYQYQKNAK